MVESRDFQAEVEERFAAGEASSASMWDLQEEQGSGTKNPSWWHGACRRHVSWSGDLTEEPHLATGQRG